MFKHIEIYPYEYIRTDIDHIDTYGSATFIKSLQTRQLLKFLNSLNEIP